MRPEKKRKLLSRFALAMLERRRLCAFYAYKPYQLRSLIRRYRYSQGGYTAFSINLESQLHIILWRTCFFKNPTAAKVFIKAGNVFVNRNRINSIGFCCRPFDFIFFENFSFNVFISKLKSSVRLYNAHLLINFRLPNIFLLASPEQSRLFNYFPIKHSYAFFTWRYRRR